MRRISVRSCHFVSHLLFAPCLAAALTGCAMQKYRAAPLGPVQTASSLEARSLDSPALRQFFNSATARSFALWPPATWDLRDLTLAAFYYNPALQVARTRVAEADAAIITAGEKPNPTISLDVGSETSPESPWLAGAGFSLPIETAGKRAYRITEAQRLADVARWSLASEAWSVRAQVRSALVDYLAARRSLRFLHDEAQVLAEEVTLLEQRLAVGMISQPEVDTLRIQQSQTLLAVRVAEGRLAQTQAALAASIGVPATALSNVQVAWPEFGELPGAVPLTPGAVQRDAVLNRIDIRKALAQYSAAEAALQLEIARQYPNIDLGPSWAYEEGSHLFSLGAGAILPIRNRNQGPIAEAKARRDEMAAHFLSVQAAGIASSEEALANYNSALKQLAQARQLLQESRAREQAAQKALESGQSDRVTLNGTRLQTAVAEIAQFDALYKTQQAFGGLENAVQRPLLPGDIQPLTPESSFLKSSERKPR
jgi:outer membrane protein, heavy metal efflux system